MKAKILVGLLIASVLTVAAYFFYTNRHEIQNISIPDLITNFTEVEIGEDNLPVRYNIDLPVHFYQTFNNCGPATLAMVLNFYGIRVGQDELGRRLRPYQNQQGDNDDKSTSLEEIAAYSEELGFKTYYQPNGNIEVLKKLTAQGIPVITKTWLNTHENIGHYRVVTGYDDNRGQILQDDSYQGPNRRFSYDEFLEIWQMLAYQYLVIVPAEKAPIVEEILDESQTWEAFLERPQPGNMFKTFNLSVANYYLGNYQESIRLYESVESQLPREMLWYQLEPIRAYYVVGNYDRVFELTDRILGNGNRAYSELYQIRGDVYTAQGDQSAAQREYDLAVLYNENFAKIVPR